jgi:hypothetical protein
MFPALGRSLNDWQLFFSLFGNVSMLRLPFLVNNEILPRFFKFYVYLDKAVRVLLILHLPVVYYTHRFDLEIMFCGSL